MVDIKVIRRDEVPTLPTKRDKQNEFDELIANLEPNEALQITPDEKGKGSIKMRLNNAAKRAGKLIEYPDDGKYVYVILQGGADGNGKQPEDRNAQN